jgi:hypothetical protein
MLSPAAIKVNSTGALFADPLLRGAFWLDDLAPEQVRLLVRAVVRGDVIGRECSVRLAVRQIIIVARWLFERAECGFHS